MEEIAGGGSRTVSLRQEVELIEMPRIAEMAQRESVMEAARQLVS
jgi:hypothetical protein